MAYGSPSRAACGSPSNTSRSIISPRGPNEDVVTCDSLPEGPTSTPSTLVITAPSRTGPRRRPNCENNDLVSTRTSPRRSTKRSAREVVENAVSTCALMPEPTVATAPTRARVTIRVEAAAAARLGARRTLPTPRRAGSPKSAMRGLAAAPQSGLTIQRDPRATPNSIAVTPIAASTCHNTAETSPKPPTAIARVAPTPSSSAAVRPRAGRSAPEPVSEMASRGVLRDARSAGTAAPARATPIPTTHAAAVIWADRTNDGCTPRGFTTAMATRASTEPPASPMIAPMTPAAAASRRTSPAICERRAPMRRSSASSRVRAAISTA